MEITVSKGRVAIVICCTLVLVLSSVLVTALTIAEHTPQSHPCDFYLYGYTEPSTSNVTTHVCNIKYLFSDRSDEQNARYEVTIKAREGNQTYWFTDDAQGMKLKLDGSPHFAVDTAQYIPQRWKTQGGQCIDMAISNTTLTYGLFSDYVEVNRTSRVQGQYTGTMTEIWHIGFDGEKYIRKSTVILQSSDPGWASERHGLKLELTGVDSVTQDNTDVRDSEGRPTKWRSYSGDNATILSFVDFPNTTRLEERVQGKKVTVHFFDSCNATGDFQVDPSLSLETSITGVVVNSTGNPSWSALFANGTGGVLAGLLVNNSRYSVVATENNFEGLDGYSYNLLSFNRAAQQAGNATITVLENSSTRVKLRIDAEVRLVDTLAKIGAVNETVTIYPQRLVYDRNATQTYGGAGQVNKTRSFEFNFQNSVLINGTFVGIKDNVTLVDEDSKFFDADIDNAAETTLPTGFTKLHSQMVALLEFPAINVLIAQFKQQLPQDDYLQIQGMQRIGTGFAEGNGSLNGTYNMVAAIEIHADQSDNETAQLRFRDFKIPDSLAFSFGNAVVDAGDEGSDGFNEKEGIYAVNTQQDDSNIEMLVFNITNSSGITRFQPSFKIFNYTQTDRFPHVIMRNSSGTYFLTRYVDYNLDFLNAQPNNNVLIMQYLNDIKTDTQLMLCDDCANPSVTEVSPVAGNVYALGTIVNVSAKVTDDVAVDVVRARVYFPNGTEAVYPMINNLVKLVAANLSFRNYSIFRENVNNAGEDTIRDWVNGTLAITQTPHLNTTEKLSINYTINASYPSYNLSFAYVSSVASSESGANWRNVTSNLSIFNYTANQYQTVSGEIMSFPETNPTNTLLCRVATFQIKNSGDFINGGNIKLRFDVVTRDPAQSTNSVQLNQQFDCAGETFDPGQDISSAYWYARITVPNNYSLIFNDTSQVGLYNITILANDTAGRLNDTEKTNFTVVEPGCECLLDNGGVESGTCMVNSTSCTVSTNITILASGRVAIINSTLLMNGPANGKTNIEVQSGGMLNLTQNSTVRNNSGQAYYRFLIRDGAITLFQDSVIRDAGWDTMNHGLEFFSSNQLLKNMRFINNFDGIFVAANNITIDNSSFHNSRQRSIVLENASNVTVVNNTIDLFVLFENTRQSVAIQNYVNKNKTSNAPLISLIGTSRDNNITNNTILMWIGTSAINVNGNQSNKIINNTITITANSLTGIDISAPNTTVSGNRVFASNMNTSLDPESTALIKIQANDSLLQNNYLDAQGMDAIKLLNNRKGNVTKNEVYTTALSIGQLISSGGGEFNIWLNHFHSFGVNASTLSNAYCVDNMGNFYNESITPLTIGAGECGLANITDGIDGQTLQGTQLLSWDPQDSFATITYELFVRNTATGQEQLLSSTASTSFDWDTTTIADGSYRLKLVPFIQSPRRNGTMNLSESFTVNNSDITPPSVMDLRPLPASTIRQDTAVNLSAKVMDNRAVDKVKANVTVPNSTTVKMDLFNSKDLLNEYNYRNGTITTVSNGENPELMNDWLNLSRFVPLNNGQDSEYVNATFTVNTSNMQYLNFSFAYVTWVSPMRANWDTLNSNLSIFNYTSNQYQVFATNVTDFNLQGTNSFNCQVVKMSLRLHEDFISNGKSNFTLIITATDDNAVSHSQLGSFTCDGESVTPPQTLTAGYVWTRIQPGHIYRGTFNDTSQNGLYNVSVIANDTSNNINATEQTNFTVIGEIRVSNLSQLLINNSDRIFEFLVQNTNNQSDNISWTFTTGEGTILGMQSVNLTVNETLFTYLRYSYGANGTYAVIATANNSRVSDSENIMVTV